MNPKRPRDLLPKVIPTDTRFQVMRLAKDGINIRDLQIGLAKSSSSPYRRRSLDYPIRIVNENMDMMLKYGLLKKSGETVRLTPLGKEVYGATKDILFRGKVPTVIKPASAKRKSNNLTYRRGPLTDTFSGALAGKTIARLLEFVEEHERTGKNWLELKPAAGGASALGSNMIRLGLIEFEKPTKLTLRKNPMRSDRGQAKLTEHPGEELIHEISNEVRTINKLTKDDIDRIKVGSGAPRRAVRELSNYLVSKGVDKSVASKVTPVETKILWLISKGHNNQFEMARMLGMRQGNFATNISNLARKGLLSRRRVKLRVTEMAPAASVLEGQKELFTTDQVLEYLRTVEKLLEKNKDKIK